MSDREKKPRFKIEDLGRNPHIARLIIPIRRIEPKDKFQTLSDGVHIPIQYEFERANFAKVYCDSERRLEIASMSVRAKELMFWIVQEIKPGEDYIWINKLRYMKENRISSVDTYKAALKELIRSCIITSTAVSGVYWINPHYFFKGDRISKYPDRVVQSNDSEPKELVD